MFERWRQNKIERYFAETESCWFGLAAYDASPEGKRSLSQFLDGGNSIPRELLADVRGPVAIVFNRKAGVVAFPTEAIRDWAFDSLRDKKNVQRYSYRWDDERVSSRAVAVPSQS